MERALAGVEAGETGQRPVEDVDPLVSGRIGRLSEGPVDPRQSRENRED